MNEDGVDEFGSGTFLYSGAKSLYISPAMSSFNLRFDPGHCRVREIFFKARSSQIGRSAQNIHIKLENQIGRDKI